VEEEEAMIAQRTNKKKKKKKIFFFFFSAQEWGEERDRGRDFFFLKLFDFLSLENPK
jgi:hypothetical protein